MTLEKLKGLESLNEIAFTDDERIQMTADFDFFAKEEAALGEFDTEGEEPAVFVLPLTNVLREDKREQQFSRESLLEAGAEHTEDSWQVPRLMK